MHTDVTIRLSFPRSNMMGPDGLYQRAALTLVDEMSGETLAALNMSMTDFAEMISGNGVHLPADQTIIPSVGQYARVGRKMRTHAMLLPRDAAAYHGYDEALNYAETHRPEGYEGDDVEVHVRLSSRGWEAIYHAWYAS